MTSKFSSLRLPPAARGSLLRSVVERSRRRSSEGPPVVVFDLDGTLMDNRPRVVAILHELAEHWRLAHAEASELCARAREDDILYGLVENLQRLGIHDPHLLQEGFAFWKQRFFSDPQMRHDVEVPGATSFVRDCHEGGAVIVYLTGRDLPNMALGSFASLRDLGFPIGVVGTELVVKPHFDVADTDFKREVAPQLGRLGPVVAVFDNEAANCNLLIEAHPECISVFLDTQHAPDPPELDPRVRVVDSFVREP